ncbi:MAG TPA: methyltransferase domain-containing protein [Burkholderiaceae bacterium]|jgi:SAM-dependent methyltransferase|nr:methyltransferase domain-containing protein [Burkholderiaceae bacterium]
MERSGSDALFAGAIPQLYERHLVPMLFAHYADDLARRVAALRPSRVLETAAGTGAVTRAMALALPDGVEIVATDLNQPMLDRAAAIGTARPVQFVQADALSLPFDDAHFDVLACQFGAMFFPDKARAFAEARRVLRPGGSFVFNVWDRIEENDFAHTVTQALARRFPDAPPSFMARTPHGYFEPHRIRGDLAAAGFDEPVRIEAVDALSRAASAHDCAYAYCNGTPLRNELEGRPGADLGELTALCARAIAQRFGEGPIEGRIRALVVSVART